MNSQINLTNKIGKGLFSTCYLQDDKKTVVLKSTDYIKECMAMGWFPSSKYFPIVEHIKDDLFKMKYYKKVSSLKAALNLNQYEIYKELRSLNVGYIKNPYNLMDAWRAEFNKVSNIAMRKALNNALDGCGNYGTDIHFEISPRNVSTNNGNLILLDCFFIKSQADKIRTKKNY